MSEPHSQGSDAQKDRLGNFRILSVNFSTDGKFLASANARGTIKIWDMAKKGEFHYLSLHKGAVFTTAFSPDGVFLASGSDDQTVRLWLMIPRLTFKAAVA